MPIATLNSSTIGSFEGRGAFGSFNLGQSGQRKSLQAFKAVSEARLILRAFIIWGC